LAHQHHYGDAEKRPDANLAVYDDPEHGVCIVLFNGVKLAQAATREEATVKAATIFAWALACMDEEETQ
jgi:hypothetical protein